MNNLDLNCDICMEPLKDGEQIYSHCINIEQFRDGAYDVVSAECDLTACNKCYSAHTLDALIQGKEYSLISKIRLAKSKSKKTLSAINNHYDCSLCDTPIPDGFNIFNSIYQFERIVGNHIEVDESIFGFISCIDCAEEHDLNAKINMIITEVIALYKRQNLKIL